MTVVSEYLIDWGIQQLQNRFGYSFVEYVYDQHNWRLGAIVESPSKKQGQLISTEYPLLSEGYRKSLDAEMVLNVIKNDEYLLLGIRRENKFYMATGTDLRLFFEQTGKSYNGIHSLSECFAQNPPICPFCTEHTPLIKPHSDHLAPHNSNGLIEVFHWRIKFCNVPLREADFVNIDRTVQSRASFYEKWLYKQMKAYKLPYFRTAELRDPILKEQFGYYPDFIPLKGKLVVELDVTTKRITVEKRRQLLAEREFRLYSIRNLRFIYSEYQKGNQRPLLNLFIDIRSHMKTLEDYT